MLENVTKMFERYIANSNYSRRANSRLFKFYSIMKVLEMNEDKLYRGELYSKLYFLKVSRDTLNNYIHLLEELGYMELNRYKEYVTVKPLSNSILGDSVLLSIHQVSGYNGNLSSLVSSTAYPKKKESNINYEDFQKRCKDRELKRVTLENYGEPGWIEHLQCFKVS